MDAKKLERIVILILLLLNAFLLAAVLSDSLQDRRARREVEVRLTALLEENGVAVGPEVRLLQEGLTARTVARNMELEQRRMEGLLGGHASEDLGGSIWFYRSDNGQVMMRGTGEFDFLLSGGAAARVKSPEQTAKKLFSAAGVELYGGAPADTERLELCCCWDGRPVYNAVLSFDFSENRLNLVSGTMVFNEETAVGERGMDSVSVLVRFVELAKSEGIICSRLDGLTPGYYMIVTMSGESTLTPVWHIETDTVELYLNALTGAQETPPATEGDIPLS